MQKHALGKKSFFPDSTPEKEMERNNASQQERKHSPLTFWIGTVDSGHQHLHRQHLKRKEQTLKYGFSDESGQMCMTLVPDTAQYLLFTN